MFKQKRLLIIFVVLLSAIALTVFAAFTASGQAPTPTPNAMSGMQMGTPTPTSATGGMQMGEPTPAPGGMTGSLPMDEPVPSQGVAKADPNAVGAQPLAFKDENGVKVFNLSAKPIQWQIMPKYENQPETWVTAWTYNGTVPGPLIRITEGDKVRIVLKNELPDATSIHWHGIPVPNDQDGVAEPAVTQNPIQPGETYTYEFVAKPAGTYFYHSHVETDRQIPIGLSGPFIIDPVKETTKYDADVTLVLNEWRVDPQTGETYPAMPAMGEPNYFTINGKAFPATQTINVKKGDRVRIRFIGAGQFEHPMHLHGASFKIIATDGNPVPEVAQLTKDTLPVHPGERFDIEFVADNPGQWAFHCHILHHVTNNDVEPGGLLFVVNVEG